MLCGGRLGDLLNPVWRANQYQRIFKKGGGVGGRGGRRKRVGAEEQKKEGGAVKRPAVHSFTHYKIFIC